MRICGGLMLPFVFLAAVLAGFLQAQTNSSSSSSAKHVRKPARASDSPLDAGTFSNGIYHNQAFAFSYKIPAGWVLRTEEMNDGDQNESSGGGHEDPQNDSSTPGTTDEKNPAKNNGRVLLAAFSRPPQVVGQDVNSSILIAAESAAAYPGLKDAAQYFGPLTEVAKAQGFTVVEEPYDIAVGTKPLVREDLQKDVGSRVMRQSTLLILGHGYVVSFNFIAGTEEEVEDLIGELSFAPPRNPGK
jgi:hypothetical protein